MENHLESLNYDTTPEVRSNARELRKRMTPAEDLLWCNLRNRKCGGYKFRRQHPINQFVADFYCHEKKVVVEVDGGYHLSVDQIEADDNRTAEMEKWDIMVLRFTNDEVLHHMHEVLEGVKKVCGERPNF